MLRSGDRMSLSSSSRSTTVRCMAFVPLSALVRVLRWALTGGEAGGGGSLRGFGELFSGRVAVGVKAGTATAVEAVSRPVSGRAQKGWVRWDWRWVLRRSDRCGAPSIDPRADTG